MKRDGLFKYLRRVRVLFIVLLIANSSFAGVDPPVVQSLLGSKNQLAKDSSVMIQDDKFFNSSFNDILIKPYKVRNVITLRVDENSKYYIQGAFSASVTVRIFRTDSNSNVDSTDQTLIINYNDTSNTHASEASYTFSGGYRVTAKIIDTSSGATWNVWDVLILDNELQSFPLYSFSCSNNAIQNISGAALSANGNEDELPVSWGNISNADVYDLEWTYIDSSALSKGRYGNSSSPSASLIFANNCSRVTISGTAYNIPMFYDGAGSLFFRVRTVQLQPGGGRSESEWSSDFTSTGGLGRFDFKGHQRNLNWQATTSYAEEGKRKTVIQYYDGSLRQRQTVTKDNSTGTVVVAETYYDYQGRPAIQVMPAPTINTIIQYSQNFNLGLNSSAYNKDNFDSLSDPSAYCNSGAAAMSTDSGSARYYSPNNPEKDTSFNRFIPDAQGYPFTETQYTQDNTGRIAKQSGVGYNFRLGSNHESIYYYGTPDKSQLDGLFGTEVGNYTHYFKTMVRDANGQYSVSYTDMHGRTIATALSGLPPDSIQLDRLPSYNSSSTTETIADSTTNVTKDLVMESQKGLLVSVAGTHIFTYSLSPQALQLQGCDSSLVCYDCLYTLEISMTDDCNNQKLGGQAFDTLFQNFTLSSIDTSCMDPNGAFSISFSKFLVEGSYDITKRLTVSHTGSEYYRDSIFLKKNTCRNLNTIISQQAALVAAANTQCVATCQSCSDSLGTYSSFYLKFMQKAGIANTDTATYGSLAFQAYQDALANCRALCDSTSDVDDIKSDMLLDLTPTGQYANPDSSQDKYSIFYVDSLSTDKDTLAVYAKVANYKNQFGQTDYYLDEFGNPDFVYDESSGELVAPQQLNAQTFATKFKSSWANALLQFHPEYCKLQQYEMLNSSAQWDLRFESTDTYMDALSKGYFDPTNSVAKFGSPLTKFAATGTPDYDPLASVAGYLSLLNDSLQNYRVKNGQGKYDISMWASASIPIKCSSASGSSCAIKNMNNDSAFVNMCMGDLDMSWRNFREMYLNVKHELINQQLNKSCPSPTTAVLVAAGHQPHFTDAYEMYSATGNAIPNDTTAAKANAQDSLTAYYDSNCLAYATQWFQQLSSCTLYAPDSVNMVIIPRLVHVCEDGADINHPYGASSVNPATADTLRSFVDVINNYNHSHGITDSIDCNGYLITEPKPYNQQVIYSSKPIFTTPDICDCDQIHSVYQAYQIVSFHYSSFSDYLNQKFQTVISDSVLNILLNLCNNRAIDTTCNFLSAPIQLPPALQCSAGDVCISCYQFSQVNARFVQQYPGIIPVAYPAPTDSVQLNKNTLYENFMNYNFGFSKHSWDYLAFMNSCGNNPFNQQPSSQCDSLTQIENNFAKYGGQIRHLDASGCDTTRWKIDSSGSGFNYNIGAPLGQIISGGVMQIPSSLVSKWGAHPVVTDFDHIGDTICVDSFFTFELRLKLPDNKIIPNGYGASNWWVDIYGDSSQAGDIQEGTSLQSGTSVWTHRNDPKGSYTITPFTAHFNDWSTLKFKFRDTVLNIYFNDTLIVSKSFDKPMTKIYGFTLTSWSAYGAVDYVRIYDTLGNYYYDEEFKGCDSMAYALPYSKCPNCHSSFVNYFNQTKGTNYSDAQVDSIYTASCGAPPNPCTHTIVQQSGQDSLTKIENQFINLTQNSFNNTVCSDTSTWKVYQNQNFSTDDYTTKPIVNNTGVPSYAIFNNGVAKLPSGYPQTNYISYIHSIDTICLSGRYSAEVRIKFDSSSVDSLHKMVGYFDNRNDTLANYYFLPNNADTTGNWRIAHWDMNKPGKNIKIYKLGIIFPNAVGNRGEIDWVRIKDSAGNVVLFEDFNSFQKFASPSSAYQCAAKDTNRTVCTPCELAFQQYYNSLKNTNYTFDQIKTIYQQSNQSLNVCPIANPGLTLCGRAAPLFPPVALDTISNCADSNYYAVSKGTEIYNGYVDSLQNIFDSSYRSKCLNAYKYESFTVTHMQSEFHYTLYYYDQAGNLVKTVPPAGVNANFNTSFIDSVENAKAAGTTLVPQHTLITQYRYNTLNQVVSQQSPDGSVSNFWYDRLGRLAISQNKNQKTASSVETGKQYSYTFYDSLGRITEVGQINNAGSVAMCDSISRNDSLLSVWIANSVAGKEQITQTIYDTAYWITINPKETIVQRNLRNRVSFTTFTKGNNSYNFNQATFFTYDAEGNVDTLLQDYGNGTLSGTKNVMNTNGNRFKKIVYQYDLVSGKVINVAYQARFPDQFFHSYTYDAENRLILVQTSKDSVHWENEAYYQYYKHGPLARTVLGQQQVQGLDYGYTLQGWMKGVNSTSLKPMFDMGNDGDTSAGNPNKYVCADVFGFSLNYFAGDYYAINSGYDPFPGVSAALNAAYRPLYNGNISSMAVNIGKFNNPVLYNYSYDQLNRLTGMDTWKGLDEVNNNWNAITQAQDYKERISYDANGNIQTYLRNGTGSTLSLNNYNYKYTPGTNQLASITNGVNGQTKNYAYDSIGNVTADEMQDVSHTHWNLYNKPDTIIKKDGTVITYDYDAFGNRIFKTVTPVSGKADSTCYVRDAAGNIMSVYHKTDSLRQEELDIYGSDKIAILNPDVPVSDMKALSETAYDGKIHVYQTGRKRYLLYNHKNDVLLTVSDQKKGIPKTSDNTLIDHYVTQVISASDYSTFGAITRNYNADTVPYGFNGQRKSIEISQTAQTAKFWEYNGDVGRRWNLDPKPQIGISDYSVFSNNPIFNIDILGDTPTIKESALLDKLVYGKKLNKEEQQEYNKSGWKESSIIDQSTLNDPTKSGLKSKLFERTINGKTEFAYAFAGTEDNTDWKNNAQQLIGTSKQYDQAINNTQTIIDILKGRELTLTGHSLGGGLANASAWAFGKASIAFNPAWVSTATAIKYGLLSKPTIGISNYIVVGEILDAVQKGAQQATPPGAPNILQHVGKDYHLWSTIPLIPYYGPIKAHYIESVISAVENSSKYNQVKAPGGSGAGGQW